MQKKRKKVKNIIIGLFALMLLTILKTEQAAAADQRLTVEQAVDFAVKNSDGIRSAKISIVKKEIEISQAIKAIADTRKNESTIRFSLLFNITFPEKHGMPKEIELLTKVPSLQSELRVLKRKVDYERLKAKEKAEGAFYEVIQKKYELEFQTERLEAARSGLETIKLAFAAGNAKKSDIEYMEKEAKEAGEAVDAAKLSFESAKDKLSGIMGVSVSSGYTFAADMPDVELSRTELAAMKAHAIKKDYNLYAATENRNVAQSDVDTISNVYQNYYGADTYDMLSYIRSCRSRGEELDYETFIRKYNRFLTRIDEPWVGNYVINLLFFKIRIPKEWFKKTFSGTRYLEDESYALFVSLLALEEAESERETVENELIAAIQDGYDAIIQSKRSYQASRLAIASAEKEYAEAMEDNILGEVTFTDLYDKKKSLMDQQKSLYDMQIDYAKSISGLNLQTSGYVEALLQKSKPNALKTYEDGVSTGESTEEGEPTWSVESAAADRSFVFRISIPKAYGVTDYELYTAAGQRIGERTKVDKSLSHLSISYADSSLLMLKLYSEETQTHVAYFDGLQYGGTLVLQECDSNPDGMVAGHYQLTNNGLLSNLRVTSEVFSFDRFELSYQGTLLGSGSATKGLSLLSVYLGTLEDYRIKLFLNDEVMAELTARETSKTEGRLVLAE